MTCRLFPIGMLIKGARLLVATAALWAIGVSLYLFFAPISIQGESSTLFRDSTTLVETFSYEQSWYEAQGLWGALVLVVFAGVYLLAVKLAWKSSVIALNVLGLTALALSVITGFSFGAAYLPAALALAMGALIFLLVRVFGARLSP